MTLQEALAVRLPSGKTLGEATMEDWQDTREPNGVGFTVIKGQRKLMDIVTSGAPVPASITAIPCDNAGQAEATRVAFGEPGLD